ncbi:hypothetical protein D3C76_885740 [compost metagenome]
MIEVPLFVAALTGTDTVVPAVSGAVAVPTLILDRSSPPRTVTVVEALATPLLAVKVTVPGFTAVTSPALTVALPPLDTQVGLPAATSIGL